MNPRFFVSAAVVLAVSSRPVEAEAPKDAKKPEPVAVLVTLSEKAGPKPADFHAAAVALLKGKKLTEMKSDKGVIGFEIDGSLVAVTMVAVPVPVGDLEALCAAAYWWPKAAETMKTHVAHLIVAVVPAQNLDRVDAHLLAAKAAAAAIRTCKATGVIVGTPLVMQPDLFADFAAATTRSEPPAEIWVEVRAIRGSAGTTMVTTGLEAFGLMEIEVVDSKLKASEVHERMFDFARYLLVKGPVLKDGDTIGGTAEEKITVKHVPSIRDKTKKVIRIGL